MLLPSRQFQRLNSMSLGLTLLLSLSACSTIPAQAPSEYHLASAAIERAEESKANKAFPITVQRAKSDMKQALQLFYQSQETGSPEASRQAVALAGLEKAEQAKSLAQKAIELHAQVNAWDQRIELKEEAEDSLAALTLLQNQLVMMEDPQLEEDRAIAMEQADLLEKPGEMMPTNVQTPVAFFATDDSGVSNQFMESMDALASTLNNNPSLKVTLIGYADQTGLPNRNNDLAEKRAENVAKALRGRGVMADQILIDAKGTATATATANVASSPDLQLDRRVDALLTKRSGISRDQMTTGR